MVCRRAGPRRPRLVGHRSEAVGIVREADSRIDEALSELRPERIAWNDDPGRAVDYRLRQRPSLGGDAWRGCCLALEGRQAKVLLGRARVEVDLSPELLLDELTASHDPQPADTIRLNGPADRLRRPTPHRTPAS